MLDPIKLEAFRVLVEHEQRTGLVSKGYNPAHHNHAVKVVPGAKYTKVDIGDSGRYMIVNETGEIFGIKGYGVIHRGHAFGTLDTIHEWNWSDYRAVRIPAITENLAHIIV